jgi:PAS domain S-box-containing protein
MRRLAEVGRIGPYEKEFLHANGSRFWLLFAGAALGDGSVVEYCLDISDRKRAEAALRASEENYRSLFESINQGFCTIEVLFDEHDQAIDYVFCETNPAFDRNTGLAGVIGKRMRDLAPAHEEHWFQTYGDIALSRQPRRFEAEAASLGRWYNVYAYPVGEPDQHQVAILSEDISERRRAEQSLRESEERYRTIVEEASDYAIFTTDAERRIDSWPAGAQAVLGWSADEAIGQPLDMAFTPEDRAAGIPEREFLSARDSGYAPNERWHIRKDGTRVFVDGSAYPRFDGAGQFLGLFKIGQDTTERRRTDEALRASEEKYRGLFASMNEGFCLYEIIRDDHGKVIDVFIHEANAAYERLTARPNAVGRTLRSIDPSVDDEWLEMMAAVVDKGEPARFTRYSPITGRWFDVRASVQDQGTPPLLALIFTDITERVTAERSLRESEERLQARVTEATDELRTLSRRLLEVHEEERRHLARELHDEIGQVLTGLQFQLATVSAADGERVAEVQKTVQDLTEQVRQLSMDLRPAVLDQYGLLAALRWHIERYGIRTGIKVDLRHEGLEARLPPPVEIAAFRVVQEALTNIVRHAETHEAFVQLLADAEALTVVVRDRGQGFDPASANPSSGLSGMRERVELLGGTLTLDSGPGEGTVIAAEVPLTVSPLLEESL